MNIFFAQLILMVLFIYSFKNHRVNSGEIFDYA